MLLGMNLNQFLSSRMSAAELARRMSLSAVLISQWRNGVRPIPVERCAAIELATGGLVARWDLRPADWHLIWPELAERPDAPALPAQGAQDNLSNDSEVLI
jgi:DNA-binding transcriptional regulator YdaS (Cro superfamily)